MLGAAPTVWDLSAGRSRNVLDQEADNMSRKLVRTDVLNERVDGVEEFGQRRPPARQDVPQADALAPSAPAVALAETS